MHTQYKKITSLFLLLLNSWSEEELVSSSIALSYSKFCQYKNNHDYYLLSQVIKILNEEAYNDKEIQNLIKELAKLS